MTVICDLHGGRDRTEESGGAGTECSRGSIIYGRIRKESQTTPRFLD